jgi:hypothetical protein
MGFRFRRSVKILPGVRLNVGKRGVSTSIGVRGAHVTFGKSGTRTTVGLPGSGLSYTHLEKAHRSVGFDPVQPPPEKPPPPAGDAGRDLVWLALTVAVVVWWIVNNVP